MHQGTSAALAEFDAWSRGYDRSILQKLIFKPSHDLLLASLTAADRRVLDIGCGTGRLASRLLDQFPGTRVWGFDLSSKMLEHGAGRGKSYGDRLQLVRGDSSHLPFRDNSFDVVTCSHSFHHYPDQAAAVAEMHRVLRPGGRLFLIDGDRDWLWGWIVFDIIVATVEGAVHHCSRRRFRRLFEAAGFDSVVHYRRGWFAPFVMTVGSANKPRKASVAPLGHAA